MSCSRDGAARRASLAPNNKTPKNQPQEFHAEVVAEEVQALINERINAYDIESEAVTMSMVRRIRAEISVMLGT